MGLGSVGVHANVTSASTACRYCLTSFVTFLRRLGLLGKARVQPGSGFAVVTEVQRGDRVFGTGKSFQKHLRYCDNQAVRSGKSLESLYPGAFPPALTNKQN